MNFKDYINELNANISDVATSEKAKKLRKTLITVGGILTIVGFVGVIGSFIAFATAGFDAFGNNGFTARVIVPFVLFPIFGVVSGIGGVALKLGLSILVGGEVSKFIDKNTNKRCECGSNIKDDEIFCSSCGRNLRKTCPQCNTIQEPNDAYCKKCGCKN